MVRQSAFASILQVEGCAIEVFVARLQVESWARRRTLVEDSTVFGNWTAIGKGQEAAEGTLCVEALHLDVELLDCGRRAELVGEAWDSGQGNLVFFTDVANEDFELEGLSVDGASRLGVKVSLDVDPKGLFEWHARALRVQESGRCQLCITALLNVESIRRRFILKLDWRCRQLDRLGRSQLHPFDIVPDFVAASRGLRN